MRKNDGNLQKQNKMQVEEFCTQTCGLLGASKGFLSPPQEAARSVLVRSRFAKLNESGVRSPLRSEKENPPKERRSSMTTIRSYARSSSVVAFYLLICLAFAGSAIAQDAQEANP